MSAMQTFTDNVLYMDMFGAYPDQHPTEHRTPVGMHALILKYA